MKKTALATAVLLASSVLAGCGSSNSNDNPASNSSSSVATKTTYSFTNSNDENTVSYTGQVARQVMIEDIKIAIGNMIKDPQSTIKDDLVLLFENTSGSLDSLDFKMTVDGYGLAQTTYGDISGGKNLVEKIAGNDTPYSSIPAGELFGWETGIGANAKAADLVNYLFDQLQALAIAGEDVIVDTTSGDEAVAKPYVGANGVDYQQLVQKFLLMAVGFSQGTNDYLGPDRDFSGELAPSGDNAYSTAEHHFDEGFGYFGASRDYAELTDAEIIAVANDTNGDLSIDLTSEYNFGQSVNCAKRDAGATVATDFTKEAIEGFITGRTIVAEATAAGTLTANQETALNAAITQAAGAWEKCIASTVVHYINDLAADGGDLSKFVGGEFDSLENFHNVAKHWSEMKGFALGLQFSPYSPFRNEIGGLRMIDYGNSEPATLEDVLSWMGDAPVVSHDGVLAEASQQNIDDYRAALMKARSVLQAAYGFATENVENW